MKIRDFGEPWSVICVDIMGPLPQSERGNKYVVVVEDAVSRYIEVEATRNTRAETVRDCILRVIHRWGCPEVLHTDNAPYFLGGLIAEMCEERNISHSLTPPHWPQANPVERTNRVIKTMLKIYLGGNHAEWDIHLRDAVFAYNTVPHSSLGNISPAYLNLGRELRPLNYRRGEINPTPGNMMADNLNWEERAARMQTLRDRVRNFTLNASERQKYYYDKKHREVRFFVGQRVLKKNITLSSAERQIVGGLAPKFAGPFQIIEIVSSVVVELEDADGAYAGRHHVGRLKPYFENAHLHPPAN